MILIGTVIGIIFDFYRVVKGKVGFSAYLINLFDFLFFLLFASIVFYRLVQINGGQVRWYIFLGVVSGVTIYYLTISKAIIQFLSKLINIFIKLVLKIKKVVLIMFSKIKSTIYRFIS